MYKKLLYLILVMIFFMAAYYPAAAEVISPSLAGIMDESSPGDEISVIVTLSDKIDPYAFRDKYKGVRRERLVRALKAKAALTQGGIREYLRQRKAKKTNSLWIKNAIAVTASNEVIREMADMPGVASIRLDRVLEAPKTVVSGVAADGWNLNAIGAADFWQKGYNGNNIIVATMDTGVDAGHPDLAQSYRGVDNSWFDPNEEHDAPYDASGHGTQVMGILAGSNNNGSSVGVAPGSQWIAVKIFDDSGFTTFSKIHAGFQWLLDPDDNPQTDDAPDVVNNSWGLDGTVNDLMLEFNDDIHALKAAGIAVTFSAGNDGPVPYSSSSPANNPEGFSVGGTDEAGSVAYFSSRGPSAYQSMIYPHVVAPAVNVRTCDLTLGGIFPDSYAYVSGTSFASAHAAGAMALLASAIPGVSVAQLEEALKNSALDLGVSGPDNDNGWGLININQAYEYLVNTPGPVDNDGDGFYSDTDCNDNDPGVCPGAPEIKNDGIDQDCNGFDLTIEVTGASYDQRRRVLTVEAASALGASANLELSGFGPMRWQGRINRWVFRAWRVDPAPDLVTVMGIEGAVSEPVLMPGIPQAPSNLAVIARTPRLVAIGWNDNSVDEKLFFIERADIASGPWRRIGLVRKDSATYNDRTVRPGRRYFYRVYAFNEFGVSEYSGICSSS